MYEGNHVLKRAISRKCSLLHIDSTGAKWIALSFEQVRGNFFFNRAAIVGYPQTEGVTRRVKIHQDFKIWLELSFYSDIFEV